MSITNIAIDFWIFSHCVNVSTVAALMQGQELSRLWVFYSRLCFLILVLLVPTGSLLQHVHGSNDERDCSVQNF